MVYEYQKETINYLGEVGERLEKLTDSTMGLKIGRFKDEFYSNYSGNYIMYSGDIYLKINSQARFRLVFDNSMRISEDINEDEFGGYVRFDKNIFLKINDWIDKIYTEKKDREQFHEKLNMELKALNKTLGGSDK